MDLLQVNSTMLNITMSIHFAPCTGPLLIISKVKGKHCDLVDSRLL